MLAGSSCSASGRTTSGSGMAARSAEQPVVVDSLDLPQRFAPVTAWTTARRTRVVRQIDRLRALCAAVA